MRAKKIDKNQASIVAALRKIPGVTVALDHDDILVGYRGYTLWYEIKDPALVGKDDKIQPSKIKKSQKKLQEEWRGHYRIVWDIEQIIYDLEIMMNLPVLKATEQATRRMIIDEPTGKGEN